MGKRYSGVLLALLTLSTAISSSAQTPHRTTPAQAMKIPAGVWLGQQRVTHAEHRRSVVGQQTLSVGANEALLELRSERGWKLRARLKPAGTSDGKPQMVAKQVDGDPLGLRELPIQVGTRFTVEVGQKDVGWGPRGPANAQCRLTVHGPPSGTSRRGKRSLLILSAAVDLAGKTERWYGNTDTIVYRDWRSGRAGEADLQASRQRVAADIKKLAANGGWKGLSQATIYVDPTRHFDFTSKSSYWGKAAILIYSHSPHTRLVYQASKKPSGYIRHVNWGTNYPMLLNEKGYDLKVRFSVLPEAGALERPRDRVPVTVIVFGNGFGDYGSGVNYEQFGLVSPTQSDVLLRRTLSLAAAGYFEVVRRGTLDNENILGQAIATYGRNAGLASLIDELIPDATESEKGYVNRFAQALISNDVSFLSLSRDACREQLLQQIKRESPELAVQAEVGDFLADIYLQRDSYRQSQRSRPQ